MAGNPLILAVTLTGLADLPASLRGPASVQGGYNNSSSLTVVVRGSYELIHAAFRTAPGRQRASTEHRAAVTSSSITVTSTDLNLPDELSYETRGSEGVVFQGT